MASRRVFWPAGNLLREATKAGAIDSPDDHARLYARPETVGHALGIQPALASGDEAGSPGQVRSA